MPINESNQEGLFLSIINESIFLPQVYPLPPPRFPHTETIPPTRNNWYFFHVALRIPIGELCTRTQPLLSLSHNISFVGLGCYIRGFIDPNVKTKTKLPCDGVASCIPSPRQPQAKRTNVHTWTSVLLLYLYYL